MHGGGEHVKRLALESPPPCLGAKYVARHDVSVYVNDNSLRATSWLLKL